MRVRGKFFVLSVSKSAPKQAGSLIKLGAVSATDSKCAEDDFYHKYTPSGSIEMYVDNPSAEAFFTIGKTVYVDFTEAPTE